MAYWTAKAIVDQLVAELGLIPTPSLVGVSGQTEVQSSQILALMNSAGNELNTYYPWQQFAKEFTVTMVPGQSAYPLPDDYKYFTDQTQWDRTNHWPLSGPKSAQEWAFLKGSLVAGFPQLRFRVMQDKFVVFPTPTSDTPFNLAMEYIIKFWVSDSSSLPATKEMASADSDVVWYDPWLIIKFTKLKFYELKGFDTTALQGDFVRTFNSLTGKDTGAPILNLAGMQAEYLLGIKNIPDGNWGIM